ncbi:hypothetical protein ACTHP5_20355 [Bacillus subtilis]|uniref:hypothetical protein n=1 Tax=Bacillus subtilis group TaxID=653685 RepID=UPI00084A2A40|nr:hypothetical protein [Bacillus subtilis]MEC2294258.1 hypothetical protein [Bacillus subtilis]MEC3665014.1 hypothetical protein [Bacillus subtilis]ODV48096.1 hypothetical protein BCM26_03885 [Bacillus subtilis]OJH64042.1 hypothetical protein BOH71_06820 [Bacillus subtilis]GLI90648.1 hypothetical protein ANABIO4_40000 [Bacillus subtilis]
MSSFNPMFRTKQPKNKVETKQANVRKTKTEEKTTVRAEDNRKTRSDKKRDVKIPFSEDERQVIKRLSQKNSSTPTSYLGKLLSQALKMKIDYPEVEYNPKGKPYPAKLTSSDMDLLFEYKVMWDCSYKQAAYRIINCCLQYEKGEQL